MVELFSMLVLLPYGFLELSRGRSCVVIYGVDAGKSSLSRASYVNIFAGAGG